MFDSSYSLDFDTLPVFVGNDFNSDFNFNLPSLVDFSNDFNYDFSSKRIYFPKPLDFNMDFNYDYSNQA